MPPLFVGLPSTAEQIDSLESFFDGMDGAPSVPSNGSIGEVLSALSEGIEVIFTKSEKDIKSFFNEFCALQQKLRRGDSNEETIVNRVIAGITKDTGSDQAKIRLLQLNNFYNFFPFDSNYRFNFFLNILTYSVETGLTKAVVPVLHQVDEMLPLWGASAEQKREIYSAISKVLGISCPGSNSLYQALKKYLETFENSEDDVSTANQAAIDAAVLAIQLEDVKRCDDLIELRAVKQLQGQKIYDLLYLFSQKNLDSFEAFNKENAGFLSDNGLCAEQCAKKMRILSLTSLASEKKILQYSQIAEALCVDSADAEIWVISAISTGLIDARIDQANEQVFIRHSSQRSFNESDWKSLQKNSGCMD
mmetsp:Transcript_74348/g.112002  ORF Transcript_74348/g.112002 Transcript_74348/m.112002 type:complete len:363 (+) Transcript_74348:29-1117(+)